MTGRTSMMRKIMVLMMAFAIMLTYSVVPMNQSFAASAKKPTKITLNAKSKTLTVGQTFKAKVKKVKPGKASKAVKWKSSNKKVATVSSKGVIKAKKAGKATITAVSKKNKKAKAKIIVTVKAKIKVKTATAEEFAAADFIVDARTADSYAGWALGDDKNGGHLENAVNISAQWLNCDYSSVPAENKTRDEAIQMEIDDSGLIKGGNIVVYDTNDKDADAVAQYLISKGYKNVKKYNASAEINAAGAKLVSYKNYKMNVPAEVVKSISDFKVKGAALSDNAKAIVGSKSADKVKILHAEYASAGKYTDDGYMKDNPIDWTKAGYYSTGHVPGAEPISTDDFEPEREAKRDIIKTAGATYGNNADIGWIADYLLRNDDELIKLVAKYGINKDDCVVVAGPEPMATTKIALVLRYAGVNDIHVMTAAYNEWNLKGFELEKNKINEPNAGTDITSIGNPDLIDTQDEAEALLNNPNAQLIDTRTVEEYNGKDSGYGYHDLVGRIDKTVNSPSGIGYSSGMYYYRNPDKTMRSQDILEAMWKKQGVDTTKHMSFFCGSGWRAAEETWDAWVLGYNASMYNDGWQGWSNAGRPFIAADGKSYALDANKGELVESTVRIDNTPDFLNMSKEKVWPHYGVQAIKDSDFVIDVRKASLFAESHYPGSVSAPVITEAGAEPAAADMSAALEAAYAKAEGKRIVIVCNTGNTLARRAMNYYQKAGKDMENITYYIGGATQLAADGKM